MFGELPKLFDRDFAIGYFLPSAGFAAATYFLVVHFNLSSALFEFSKESFLKDLASFGLVSLLGAIILLVANRSLIRFLEGYWAFDLGRFFNLFEVRRYEKLIEKEEQSDIERQKYGSDSFPQDLRNRRDEIKESKAERFPDSKHLILPTSFGNSFRAFEVYSRVMYGIDAIPGWYRLLAVIPADYRNLIGAARSKVDFWVNVCFVSSLVAAEYLITIFFLRPISYQTVFNTETLIWVPAAALAFSYTAFRFAANAARTWGNWVKAAFDVYLPELRKKLEFGLPKDNERAREMWENFSRAVIYRHAEFMPEKTAKASDAKTDSLKDFPAALERNIEHLLVFKTALELLKSDYQAKRDDADNK